MTPRTAGVVLAAGAGVRMGTPKALLVAPDGRPWVASAHDLLVDAGLGPVVVVLGAAPAAGSLVPSADIVVAERWRDGIDASLGAALRHLEETTTPDTVTSVAVTLVDLGDLTRAVVRRVVDTVGPAPSAAGRATYAGRPGHPVVLGRDHWSVAPDARREILRRESSVRVDCTDLASGADRDRPDDLPPGTARLDPATGRVRADLPGTNRG